MILEVRDDGVTVVNMNNPHQILLLATAMVNVLKNIPELNALVGGMMSGRINPEEFGVTTKVRQIKQEDDQERVIRSMQEEEPANDDEIPDFVKRSLKDMK